MNDRDGVRALVGDFARRAAAAAARQTPGGLAAAVDRMAIATDGQATTLTEAQLEVLTLLAHGIGTVRDLCAARGFSSTNGQADHLDRLERRGLIERVVPAEGRATRYAPWVLTSAGWRTLGPCSHVVSAVATSALCELQPGRLWITSDQRNAPVLDEPIAFCPWCGWRLW